MKTNIDRSKIKDIENKEIIETGDEEGDKFLKELQKYAKKNSLKITNIKSWTMPKIVWMANNDKKCACAPTKRVCPCPEGLKEVKEKGRCLCSVFERA